MSIKFVIRSKDLEEVALRSYFIDEQFAIFMIETREMTKLRRG